MNFDSVAMIIAICSIVILIVLGFVWYKVMGKKTRRFHISVKKNKNVNEKEDIQQSKSTGNDRLDGARVSHRRTHPDRVAQEAAFKEIKTREEEKYLRKLEFEKKNNLQLVYSPCNGDVISSATTISEAKQIGLYNPGVIIRPVDNNVIAPVNGIIKEIKEDDFQILLDTRHGLKVVLKIDPGTLESTEESWKPFVTLNDEVRVGDPLYNLEKIATTQPASVSIILDSYKPEQLLLIKNVSFLSAGDKLITIKAEI